MNYQVDQEEKARLERQHCRVQDEIKKLPQEQQDWVKRQSMLVDAAMEECNEMYFGDGMFAIDRFLATHGVSGSDRDAFVDCFKRTQKCKTFIFNTNTGRKAFYRTPSDQLMGADDYIYTLEYSVLNTNRLVPEKVFTGLALRDILRLTLKTIRQRLLGGNNGPKEEKKRP